MKKSQKNKPEVDLKFTQKRVENLIKDIHTSQDDIRGRFSVKDKVLRFYKKFSTLDEADRFSIVNRLSESDNFTARAFLEKVLVLDHHKVVRHEAAFSLGCVGDNESAGHLRHAMSNDESTLVRHESAMALSEVGSEVDLEYIEKQMNDQNEEVVLTCEIAKKRLLTRLALEGEPVSA